MLEPKRASRPVNKGFPPTFGEAFDAHMAQSVVATTTNFALRQHHFEDVPGFNPLSEENLKGRPGQWDAYMFAGSPEEMDYIDLYARRGQENRRIIHEYDSFGLSLLEGLVDPLAWAPIPLLKGVGFAAGAVRGAGGVGASVAGSEVIRQFTDPNAVVEESVLPVAGGVLVGSLLGGLLGRVGARARAQSDELWEGMQRAHDDVEAGTFNATDIPPEAGAGPARRARETSDYEFDGPGFFNTFKWAEMPFYRLKNILTEHFPNADINKIPELMVGLPGLITRMNRMGETAGTAATNLARQHDHTLAGMVQTIERGFVKMRGQQGEPTNPGMASRGVRLNDFVRRISGGSMEGRMTLTEFNQEVGRAVVLGDHAIPEVAETARHVKKYFDDWAEQLEADGVLFSPLGLTAEITRINDRLIKKRALLEDINENTAHIGPSHKQGKVMGRLSDEIEELNLQIEIKTRQLEGLEAGTLKPADFLPLHFKVAELKRDLGLQGRLHKVLEDHYKNNPNQTGRTAAERADDTMRRILREDFDDPLAFQGMGDHDPWYLEIIEQSRLMRQQLGRQPTYDELATAMNRSADEIEAAFHKAAEAESVTPRELVARKLDIPREKLLDFINTDVDILVRSYGRRMAAVNALNRNFGHYSMFDQIEEVKASFRELMLKPDADVDALAKAMDDAVKDIEVMRDRMLGVYKLGDADSWTEEALTIAKGMGNLTLMGRAVQVAAIDVALLATAAGMSRTWRSGLMAMMRNREQFKLAYAEAERAGIVAERILHGRVQEITNTAGLHASTPVGRTIQGLQPHIFSLSLFNLFTDTARKFASGIVVSNMADTIKAIATGTTTKAMERDIAQLARGGIGKAEAIEMWAKIEKHGALVDDVWAVNTQAWGRNGGAGQVLAEKFRAAMIDTVDNIVIMPGIADTPNFMAKGVFSALLQYRRFGISASQRIAGSAMQFKDARALAGMTSMVAFAYLLESTWRAPRFDNREFDEKLLDAVETSGITGLLLDANNMFEQISGNQLGLRPMLGMKGRVKNPNWATQVGAVASPAGATALNLGRALFDPDATPGDQAYAIRRSWPFQNMWWSKGLYDGVQGGLETLLDPSSE